MSSGEKHRLNLYADLKTIGLTIPWRLHGPQSRFGESVSGQQAKKRS